ncbi:MAG: hypothetical protein ACXWRE_12185 [Pseudobdellovibrionaceae bacterium]
MSTLFAEKTFVSFDGSESYEGKLFCPDRYRLLENTFQEAESFALQGAGLSYAPLSFGAGSASIQLTHFDRFLALTQQAAWSKSKLG